MAVRTRGKSWNEFTRWCQARGLRSLPTHAWTLAAFVRWCEHRYDYATIVAITKAIARMHLIAGHSDPERHPIVRRTLAMTERSISNRHHRSALFDDDFVSEKPIKKQLSEQIDDKLKKSPPEKRVLRAMRLTPKLVRRKRRPI
ncbi:MAG: hypothetical protein CMF71_02425 [Magnetovibrio sp.]|nr:hypothetical protein [Magnetovibrio sp.]|tara:strand:- start:354 stop:785 length:432 start_codon:yes stop_codon:yes gene_type:complete